MMDRGAVHHGPLEQLTLKQITAERKGIRRNKISWVQFFLALMLRHRSVFDYFTEHVFS